MAFFEWEERFSVGVKSIDGQHKVLMGCVSNLADAIASKNTIRTDSAAQQLTTYAKIHFAHEELLFEIHKYPDRISHTNIHKKLFKGMELYLLKYRNNEIEADFLLNILKKWFEMHIIYEDMKYTQHFTKHEVH